MTREEMEQLYRAHIIPENRAPYHFEVDAEAPMQVQAYNPMCGDKFTLYLHAAATIEKAHFHGIGCAISKASGSLLMRELEGKSTAQIQQLCEAFLQSLEPDSNIGNLPEALQTLAALKNFDGRLDCIRLPWKALLDALTSPDTNH